jgi:hypothetical protein
MSQMTSNSASGYVIGRSDIVGLVAGRASHRASWALANLLLVAAWQADYAPYAAAMGSSIYLLGLTSLGIEKTVLKLAPRHISEGANNLISCMLTVLVGAVALAVTILIVDVRESPVGALALLAGGYQIATGANQVLVGMHRALTGHRIDYVNYGALTTSLLVATGLTTWSQATPMTFLLVIVSGVIAANAWLLLLLRQRTRTARLGSLPDIRTLDTTWKMSVADVVPAAMVSLSFLVLDASGRESEAPALYLTLAFASLALSLFDYVLRIFQPRVSLLLDDRDITQIWSRTRLWLRRYLVIGSAHLLALGSVAGLLMVDDRVSTALATGLTFVGAAPLIVAMASLNYLLENATDDALRLTAFAGLGSIVPYVAAALLLVPSMGAVGSVLALATAEIGHAAILAACIRQGVGVRR